MAARHNQNREESANVDLPQVKWLKPARIDPVKGPAVIVAATSKDRSNDGPRGSDIYPLVMDGGFCVPITVHELERGSEFTSLILATARDTVAGWRTKASKQLFHVKHSLHRGLKSVKSMLRDRIDTKDWVNVEHGCNKEIDLKEWKQTNGDNKFSASIVL